MRYDPIMCMMVDDSVKTKDAEFQMFGPEFHHPIIKANSKEEAIKKAKEIYGWGGKVEAVKVSDEKTIDKAIRNCDYAYGTAEIKDVNGKWVVFHSGKYVQEFDNSDDAEAFVREKGWH